MEKGTLLNQLQEVEMVIMKVMVTLARDVSRVVLGAFLASVASRSQPPPPATVGPPSSPNTYYASYAGKQRANPQHRYPSRTSSSGGNSSPSG
jgi:hypothetical protein